MIIYLRIFISVLLLLGALPGCIFLVIKIDDYMPEEWERKLFLHKKWVLYCSAVILIVTIIVALTLIAIYPNTAGAKFQQVQGQLYRRIN